MQAGLKSIRRLVKSTALPTGVEHTVLFGFDQLPQLYNDLNRTYDSRYSDRILGVIGGILKTLSSPDAGGPAAEKLAVTIGNRLRDMHDKHGIAVALKAPVEKKKARAVAKLA
jgi:hypothetical protein